MITYKAVLASCGAVEEDIKRAAERIGVIKGVKVLEATGKHILVQFDADIQHLVADPMLQRQMDILRGDVRAEIEKIGGLTIKQCAPYEITLIKKITLFIKKLFKQ